MIRRLLAKGPVPSQRINGALRDQSTPNSAEGEAATALREAIEARDAEAITANISDWQPPTKPTTPATHEPGPAASGIQVEPAQATMTPDLPADAVTSSNVLASADPNTNPVRGPTPFPRVAGWWGDLLRWAFSGEAQGPSQQVLAFTVRGGIILIALTVVELIARVGLTALTVGIPNVTVHSTTNDLADLLAVLDGHLKAVAATNLTIGGVLATKLVSTRRHKTGADNDG